MVILRSGKVEYVDLPFALTRQYRLYHEAVSTFKTNGIDRLRFERSYHTAEIVRIIISVFTVYAHGTLQWQLLLAIGEAWQTIFRPIIFHADLKEGIVEKSGTQPTGFKGDTKRRCRLA